MSQPKFKFELNEELQDVITGFKGIVMVRSEYSTGCRHYGIQAPMNKEGILPSWEYIDESRLITTGRNLSDLVTISLNELSGPFQNPPQL